MSSQRPGRRRRPRAVGPPGATEPWIGNLSAALARIDDLDDQIDACEQEWRHLGADHPYVPLPWTAPGIAWVLGYTIAAELGDIARFPSPKQAVRLHRAGSQVSQSGRRDQRGPLAKNGPPSLRWALIEAAIHAAQHPCYRDHYQRIKQRLGKQRVPGSPGWRLPASSPRPSGTAHRSAARCSGKAPTSALVA